MQILPDNGHALLLIYDPQPVDMSQIVAGGVPTATVIGLVVQELDTAKNVVFQWRSWDHMNITDSQRRIIVEHTIGRLRRYEALSQADRHHRRNHTERVVAVAGLVNRQIRHRLPTLDC